MNVAPHCVAPRRIAGRGLGAHHQPLLLVRLAGDCHGGGTHYERWRGSDCRRRHRIDDDDSDGRAQSFAESLARRSLSGRLPQHGSHRERVGQRFGITREAADEFSLRSHQKALAAIQAGRFDEEVVPVPVSFTTPNGSKPKRQEIVFKMDEGPRADTSLEALLALKPAFHVKGTVTAGNSSQMSDGAAAAVVMSAERAKALGIKPLARYVSFATAGYKPEEMGLGPVFAIPKALKMAGLKLSDIDVIELNEAFAAQSLAVIQEAGLDPEKVNPSGGAIALGHPLGCTGAKLTATIIRELKRRNGRYGMVTMCVGGGMGAAGIFENLN